jgi:hypothetical protein
MTKVQPHVDESNLVSKELMDSEAPGSVIKDETSISLKVSDIIKETCMKQSV